ncbi:hypothetical protein F2Q70_00010990 [Brassica cretica]|uniref:Uncharacterized protein n=2 Tax=Brassica cretica TaxID=69181 RepID=A0A8S9MFS6_BRACR|nr:hypothetical protein F2Q68_00004111 [Brassica cretica]KAF2615953.1 hypothetical protein F2Q70_00010990 [Brassica cretica]KAF3542725.1 hypothetical protein DY000_02005518 [Brassica cretica]
MKALLTGYDARGRMHGDGISLTSRVPAAFQGRGRRGDGVGTFPKRFREAGDGKGFWGRHG